MKHPYIVPRQILAKYATSGPRYTSYPTAPEWSTDFNQSDAARLFHGNNQSADRPLSLYFHLPFCHSLCYYCGCNVKISRNKNVTVPYLAALKHEMEMVAPWIHSERKVFQMHWGGGTPTYLSPRQIAGLVELITTHFSFHEAAEISIEVDPRVTTQEHVKTLRKQGFNRISMGVQDFDAQVQKAVNRLQPFEQTQQLIEWCREAGFLSVNIDLMYGLPFQTRESFSKTLIQVQQLSPDRIALFNYAHVPWLKPGQKLIKEETLPLAEEKLSIFELAIHTFLDSGYVYIGMDHFARPTDELAVAQQKRTLQRNFMGYTTHAGTDLYGFGVSSISEIDGHFTQNLHKIPDYEKAIDSGNLAVMRGMWLDRDDRIRKEVIARLSCHCYLDFDAISQLFAIDFTTYFAPEIEACRELAEDGLLETSPQTIQVLPRGQILIRNVCMIWDAYLQKSRSEGRKFSQTV